MYFFSLMDGSDCRFCLSYDMGDRKERVPPTQGAILLETGVARAGRDVIRIHVVPLNKHLRRSVLAQRSSSLHWVFVRLLAAR